MQKLLIPFLIVSLLTFSGCKKTSTVKPKFDNLFFTVDVLWETQNFVYSATTENSQLFLTSVSPENQKNTKIAIKNDTLTFNYLGLEKSISSGQIPQNSFLNILRLAFNTKENVINENNSYYIKLTDDKNEYLLFITQSGLPLKIICSDSENQILFKGVTIKN